MKNKKNYTLILTSNTSQSVKRLSFSQKQLKIFFGIFIGISVGLVAFLTDYVGLARNQLELKSLRGTNQSFKQELDSIKNKYTDLKNEVDQLEDFSRKVRFITTGLNRPSSYGKVSYQASLMDITSPAPSREPSTSPEVLHVKKEKKKEMIDEWTNEELIINIGRLKKKSRLVKQNTWDLYGSLLEKKEILNNTPSILPTRGWVTSQFGYRNETLYTDHEPHFHRGMDIAARTGSPVFSTGEGRVTYTGYDEQGYGKLIIIDHGYGLKTYYAHLSQIKISSQTYVKRGEVIGYVGNTGKSTGPHLHYEIRILGIPVNPTNYVLNGSDSSDYLSYNH